MNYDQVWQDGIAPAIATDAEIVAVVGDAIYLAPSLREYESPSLNAMPFLNTEEENWAPAEWQFDGFAKTAAGVLTLARSLRRLFHQELQIELGPFKLWCQLIEDRGIEGPNKDGDFRCSLDFRFTPGRSLYLTAQES